MTMTDVDNYIVPAPNPPKLVPTCCSSGQYKLGFVDQNLLVWLQEEIHAKPTILTPWKDVCSFQSALHFSAGEISDAASS